MRDVRGSILNFAIAEFPGHQRAVESRPSRSAIAGHRVARILVWSSSAAPLRTASARGKRGERGPTCREGS